MERMCMKENCGKRAGFCCESVNPVFYMCKKHYWDCMGEYSEEDANSLLTKLHQRTIREISDKIETVFQILTEAREKVIESTKKLLECIFAIHQKTLEKLEKFETRIKGLYKNINDRKSVYNDDYSLFCDIKRSNLSQFFFNMNEILTKICEFYNVDFSGINDDNEILVMVDDTRAINFASMKCSDCDYISENKDYKISLLRYSQCSKIKPFEYFYFGSNEYPLIDNKGVGYIINTKQKKFELVSGIDQLYGASICKNNKIYSFGGSKSDICYSFDLSLREWTWIGRTQANPMHSTACLFEDAILLTGLGYDGIYLYDEDQNTYSIVSNVMKRKAKVLMHGWMISTETKKIYQITLEKGYELQEFSVDRDFNLTLLLYSSFVFKRNIYFITAEKSVMRINTSRKKLEPVGINLEY
jgi:hypothetical protein